MDPFHGVSVSICGDEDDRCLAYLPQPPSDFDPFATSLKTNVHQDNIGLIAHCTRPGSLGVCRKLASIEAQLLHVGFKAKG